MSDATMMIPVPFNSDTLWAADRDGEVLVAMKPIVENLGLNWRAQYNRLRRTPILAKGVVMMTTPSPGGAQEMACLPLKMLAGWLFGVDVKRVKPALRERLDAYQAQCFEVLWQYFRGEISTPRPGIGPTSVEINNGIEAHLHHHQLQVLHAVKAYGKDGAYAVYANSTLSQANSKRAIMLLWYLHIIEVREERDGFKTLHFVPPDKRPSLPLNPYKRAKRLA